MTGQCSPTTTTRHFFVFPFHSHIPKRPEPNQTKAKRKQTPRTPSPPPSRGAPVLSPSYSVPTPSVRLTLPSPPASPLFPRRTAVFSMTRSFSQRFSASRSVIFRSRVWRCCFRSLVVRSRVASRSFFFRRKRAEAAVFLNRFKSASSCVALSSGSLLDVLEG